MKFIHVLLSLCLVVGVVVGVGCSKVDKIDPTGENAIIGYVVKKEAGQFLLVSSQLNAKNDYEANWVTSNEVVALGQLIEVSVTGGEIKATNPGIVTAETVTIWEEKPKRGAREIIERALLQHHDLEVPIVKSITYSEENKEWLVILSDKKTNDQHDVSVSIVSIQE